MLICGVALSNLIARRISLYASRFVFLRALHLTVFEQPAKQTVFQHSGSNFEDIPTFYGNITT
jgi:hypothetical protein